MKAGLNKLLNWLVRKPGRIERMFEEVDVYVDETTLLNADDWEDIADKEDDYELWCNINPNAKPPGLRFGYWKKTQQIEPWFTVPGMK